MNKTFFKVLYLKSSVIINIINIRNKIMIANDNNDNYLTVDLDEETFSIAQKIAQEKGITIEELLSNMITELVENPETRKLFLEQQSNDQN